MTPLLASLALAATAAAAGPVLHEPLPLDVAADVRYYQSYEVSSDGGWLAYSSAPWTPRLDATRTQILDISGDSTPAVVLSQARSWAPRWSPDGKRLAYFADDGGGAGLWIWRKDTRVSRPIAGISVLPQEQRGVSWLPDGRHLLVLSRQGRVVKAPDSSKPLLVKVLRSGVMESGSNPTETQSPSADATDLVLVDIGSGKTTRREMAGQVSWFAPSPDGRLVAYTLQRDFAPNSFQRLHDLYVVDLQSGSQRLLGEDLRLQLADTIAWSPDARQLAYSTQGPLATGEMVVVDVAKGVSRTLSAAGTPKFGRHAPIWETSGEHVYAVADGALWRVDVASARAEEFVSLAGQRITSVASTNGRVATSGAEEHAIFVTAVGTDLTSSSVYRVDLTTHERIPLLQGAFVLAGGVEFNSVTRELSFIGSDQKHPQDVEFLNVATGALRRPVRDHEVLNRYELGATRLIHWYGLDGQLLTGALLLPPDYRAGERLPLVVWVYGGDFASRHLNSFGLQDAAVYNMQVLATRGYAVLFPDCPERPGHQVADVVGAVMPGVNAAIDQGYADAERLTVMGHSHGSYGALSLITQTTRFKAAEIGGVQAPDLLSEYLYLNPEGFAPGIAYMEHGQGSMGGTLWEHPDRYVGNSPIFAFDRIVTPLLIANGTLNEALEWPNNVFVALRRLGKTAEYRVYDGEDHVIHQRADVIDLWKRRLEFFSEHLNMALDEKGHVLMKDGRVMPRQHG